MLENCDRQELATLLNHAEDRIQLPTEWQNFFTEEESILPRPEERRQFVRRHARMKAALVVKSTLTQPDRSNVIHCIYCRDLSRGGLSFIHAQELYPGDDVAIRLPTCWINLTVVYCKRQNDRCYVVGGSFTSGLHRPEQN